MIVTGQGDKPARFIGPLLLAAALVYALALTHEFVNFDDSVYVTDNPQVQAGLTWAGMQWALGSLAAGYWHPVTWLTHMADCEVFGLRAWGHHLTSVLWHLANTAMLFALLRRMTGATGRSAVVAGLFALHPLHVESVAWIAERKDVVSTFWLLLTLWAYGKGNDECRRMHEECRSGRFTFHVSRFHALSLLCFALGLMSKPMLVTVPMLLLLLDYWPLGRLPATRGSRFEIRHFVSLLLEKLPFFFLAAACALLTWYGQRRLGALALEAGPSLPTRAANAAVSYVTYLAKTIWPSRLAVFYPYPETIPIWKATGAVLMLVGITAAAIHWRRQRLYLLFGWLWYVVTLLPVSGLIQVGSHAMADRYTYVPLIGIFVALVWGFRDVLEPRLGRKLLAVGAVAILALCWAGTMFQLQHWKNSESLFRHALRVVPPSGKAHNSLGIVLLEQGELAPAAEQFAAALRSNPAEPEPRNNLGLTLLMQGKTSDATGQFRELLRLRPDYAEAHNNLGKALAEQGRLTEATAEFAEALLLKPAYTDARHNLNVALAEAANQTNENAKARERLNVPAPQPSPRRPN